MLGNLVEKKIRWLLVILAAWAVAAYLVIPRVAKLYYRHHFTDGPRVTQTADDHPGDPVNIAIEGEEESLVRAMHAAGWYLPQNFQLTKILTRKSVFPSYR